MAGHTTGGACARWAACAMWAALLAVNAASADGVLVFDATRFVASSRNECTGVPGCLTVDQSPVQVTGQRAATARFSCPQSHPNLWSWDVAQHEHVVVDMVDVDAGSLTVKGVGRDPATGVFRVSLGCSRDPYAGSGFFYGRAIVPSGTLQKGR